MTKNNALPPASQPWVRELERRIKELENKSYRTDSKVNVMSNRVMSPKVDLDALSVTEIRVGGDEPQVFEHEVQNYSISGNTITASTPPVPAQRGFIMEWEVDVTASVDYIQVSSTLDPEMYEDPEEPTGALAGEETTYFADASYMTEVVDEDDEMFNPVPPIVSFTLHNPAKTAFTFTVHAVRMRFIIPGEGGLRITQDGEIYFEDGAGHDRIIQEISEEQAQAIVETADNLANAKQELDEAAAQARQDLDVLDDKLGSAFPGNNIFDVDLAIEQAKQQAQLQFDASVVGSLVEYSRNSNETNPPITGWSTTPPARTPGTFIWMRTTVSYGSGDTSTSEPVLLTGNDGIPGAPGVGITNTEISYARSTSGASAPASGWQEQPPSPIKGQFLWTRTIWTYTNNATETGYSSSYWATDGASGTDGDAGKDGTKLTGTVNHYAQSTSGTTHPTSGWALQPPTAIPGRYMWTRSTWSYDDGTTEHGYTVGKIGDTGPKGEDGPQGVEGPRGPQGQALYTWIKYAPNGNPTSAQMSESPVDMTYMGIAHNQTVQTEGNDPSAYSWSLIKGPEGNTGIQGPDGKDGQSLYTWVKYAPNGSPTSGQITDLPQSDSTHIGLAYNKTTASETTVPGDYTWSLIKGPKGDKGEEGEQGLPGLKGKDGTQYYTWLKYAPNSNPTSAQMTDVPNTNSTHMGMALNQTSSTEGTDPSAYTWSRIKGTDGVKGDPGPDGKSLYTWVKYAPNGSPTNSQMTDLPQSNSTHIGLAYNKNTATESTSASAYTWTLIQGPKGEDGEEGEQGVSVTSIAPHFRRLAESAAKPAKPSGMTPSGWSEMEPAYARDTTVWRSDRIVFSNDQITWTEVSKLSSYEAAKAAEASALAYADQKKQEAIDAGAHDLANLKIGGRNLLPLDGIWTSNVSSADLSEYAKTGRVRVALSSSNGGLQLRFDSTGLGPNEDFVLSYKYRKLSGTLVSFGGHTDTIWGTPNTEAWVDGVKRGLYNGHSSVFVADDEEFHEVVVYGRTGNEGSDGSNLWIQPNRNQAVAVEVEILDLKLERGTKATDWTPAPEDVDAGIAGAIDALDVGGRNYMLNSAQPSSPFVVNSNNSTTSPLQKGTDEIGDWITGTTTATGQFYISTYTNPTFETGRGVVFSEAFYPQPDVYTQSVEVMSDVSMTVQLGSTGDNTLIQPNEWTRVHRTFTPSDTSASRLRLWGPMVPEAPNVPVGTKLYIRNWKLGKGARATDWTPAPEDVEAGIADAHAGGRNLIIDHNAHRGRYIHADGSFGYLSGTDAPQAPVPVKPGDTYTFSKGEGAGSDPVWRVGYYNETDTFINRVVFSNDLYTLTIPNGVHFVRTSYPSGCHPQMERGTHASPWKRSPEDVEAGIADAHAAADAAGGVADKAWDSLYIHDTRDDNEPPSWYITNYNRTSVTEFKRAATVGLPSSVGTYVHVRTTVKWTDGSGGAVIQETVANDGRVFTRHGAGEHWYDWRDRAGEAQAEALSAINMANGKNAASYSDVADSVAAPGPAPSKTIGDGRRVHDMHRNRRSNGQIIGEWIWTGTAWTQLKLSDAMLSSLDVGLLSAGGVRSIDAVIQNLWAEGLVARVGTFSRAIVAAQNLIPGIEVLSQYGDLTPEEKNASPFRAFEINTTHPSLHVSGRKNAWIWANISVRAGERYRFSVDAMSPSAVGARFSIRTMRANSDGSQGTVFMSWTDFKSSSNTSVFSSYPFNNTTTGASWTSYWAEMTATANGVISFLVEANISAGTTNTGPQYFRNFTMKAMTDGNLLVDGAVTSRTLNVVPDSGTGGMELKPEGLRIIPSGEGAGTAVSLRVGEENTLSFAKDSENTFAVNEFGDISGESLDVRGVLKEGGVPLQEMLKALPQGYLGRAEMSGTSVYMGTEAGRVVMVSIRTPPENRLMKVTVSLRPNVNAVRHAEVTIRQKEGEDVQVTNSQRKVWPVSLPAATGWEASQVFTVDEWGWPYDKTITLGVFVKSITANQTIQFSSNHGQTITVEDVGLPVDLQTNNAYAPPTGGGSGGSGGETDKEKRYYDGKFYPAANMVQSYQGGNAKYDWNKSMLFHGYNLSANGRLRSMALFNRSAVETLTSGTGTEMVSGHIKLYNSHTWSSQGMTVRVGYVSSTSIPDTWNGTTNFTLIGSYTVGRGGVLTIPLTATHLARIKSGAFRGIALVSNTNTASHYGYFNASKTELYVKVRK